MIAYIFQTLVKVFIVRIYNYNIYQYRGIYHAKYFGLGRGGGEGWPMCVNEKGGREELS